MLYCVWKNFWGKRGEINRYMIEENKRLRFQYRIDGVKRKHIYVAYLNNLFGDWDRAEWRPAGSLLLDFINFDLDLFRFGKKIDVTTGELATADTQEENIHIINAHNFEDYTFCDDEKLHLVGKDENGDKKIVLVNNEYPEFSMDLYIDILPEILHNYADEFIDFKYGRYGEEWENLKLIQRRYREIIDKIFNLNESEKEDKTPKELYNDYFKVAIKKWKVNIPDYDFFYEKLNDFLDVELYNLVCDNKHVFKCVLCKKYSISDKKTAIACDRPNNENSVIKYKRNS